jgi:hypothetical protein
MRDTREMRKAEDSSFNHTENHCYYEEEADFVEEINGRRCREPMFSRKESSSSNSRKSVVEPLGLKTSNIQHK